MICARASSRTSRWKMPLKAVELGFADGILHGAGDTEDAAEGTDAEGVMFSRTAVANSLLSKLVPEPGKKGTPVEQLEKRLNLLVH